MRLNTQGRPHFRNVYTICVIIMKAEWYIIKRLFYGIYHHPQWQVFGQRYQSLLVQVLAE